MTSLRIAHCPTRRIMTKHEEKMLDLDMRYEQGLITYSNYIASLRELEREEENEV